MCKYSSTEWTRGEEAPSYSKCRTLDSVPSQSTSSILGRKRSDSSAPDTTKVLGEKTPYEVLYKKVPSYENIKTFGCLCFVHHTRRDRDKFGMRSKRCILVGYSFGKKRWKLYDMEKDEFVISRDVVFEETIFPWTEKREAETSVLPRLDLGVYDETQAEMMIDRGRSDIAPGVERVEETEIEGVQEMTRNLHGTRHARTLHGSRSARFLHRRDLQKNRH